MTRWKTALAVLGVGTALGGAGIGLAAGYRSTTIKPGTVINFEGLNLRCTYARPGDQQIHGMGNDPGPTLFCAAKNRSPLDFGVSLYHILVRKASGNYMQPVFRGARQP